MNKQIDTSIPILTEVIPAVVSATETSTAGQADTIANASALPDKPTEVAATHAAKTSPANTALGIRMLMPAAVGNESPAASTPKADEEKHWQALEQQVREAVLKQLLGRVDFVLEHRVRDNLADVLQLAVASLTTEIRSGLEKTLEDVISRAISQEINKLRQTK